MRPYSTDLRERIVDAYHKAEGSVRELAARFKVAPKTVQNYLNLRRKLGAWRRVPTGAEGSHALTPSCCRRSAV